MNTGCTCLPRFADLTCPVHFPAVPVGEEVDDALEFAVSGGARSIAAEESKLSVICRTDDCLWLNVKDFPPPDRHLVLLHGPLGKYGIGYFDNGVQMESGHTADWEAGYWVTLPCGPNTLRVNFIDRKGESNGR